MDIELKLIAAEEDEIDQAITALETLKTNSYNPIKDIDRHIASVKAKLKVLEARRDEILKDTEGYADYADVKL